MSAPEEVPENFSAFFFRARRLFQLSLCTSGTSLPLPSPLVLPIVTQQDCPLVRGDHSLPSNAVLFSRATRRRRGRWQRGVQLLPVLQPSGRRWQGPAADAAATVERSLRHGGRLAPRKSGFSRTRLVVRAVCAARYSDDAGSESEGRGDPPRCRSRAPEGSTLISGGIRVFGLWFVSYSFVTPYGRSLSFGPRAKSGPCRSSDRPVADGGSSDEAQLASRLQQARPAQN